MIAYVAGYDENHYPVVAWQAEGEWRALHRSFTSIDEAIRCVRNLEAAERRDPMLAGIPTPYRVLREIQGA